LAPALKKEGGGGGGGWGVGGTGWVIQGGGVYAKSNRNRRIGFRKHGMVEGGKDGWGGPHRNLVEEKL